MLVPPPIATPQIAPCWGLLLLLLAFPVGDSLPSILRQSLSTGPSAHLHQDPSSWDLLLARNLGQGATPRKIICILSFTFKWGLNGGIMPFERNSKNHDKCWSHPGRTNDHPGTSCCTRGLFGSSDSARLRLWLRPWVQDKRTSLLRRWAQGRRWGFWWQGHPSASCRRAFCESSPGDASRASPGRASVWAFEVILKRGYTYNHRQIDRINRRAFFTHSNHGSFDWTTLPEVSHKLTFL